MKLADLRKLAIRKHLKINFALRNGMECVIGEDGVARLPALHAVPDFNLEQELAEAASFVLEPLIPAGQKIKAKKSLPLSRQGMMDMATNSPSAAPVHGEHEDE